MLDVSFYIYISDVLASSGYGLFYIQKPFNIMLYILSFLLLIISTFLAKKLYLSSRNSANVMLFLFYISFVPFTTMLGFSVFTTIFIILNISYWLFLIIFYNFMTKIKINNRKIIYKENRVFIYILLSISLLSVLYFGIISEFRIDLNIFNAYDYRNEVRNIDRSGLSTYLLGLSRIVIPTGITYTIKKRKYFYMLVFLIFAMLNYSFDGSKTLYFISIIAVLVGFFYKPQFKFYIPAVLVIFLVVGYIEYVMFSSNFIYLLIVRRLFFVPNLINSAYADFMINESPNMFSNLLRFIGIDNSYNVANLIGLKYFGSPTMSANTGTVGDALWQFKYLGILILPLFLAVFLYFLDISTKNVPTELMLIPSIIFAYYLNNSSLTAASFSHGLVIFMIIMYFYSRRIHHNKYQ
jgi:hypothetical protein